MSAPTKLMFAEDLSKRSVLRSVDTVSAFGDVG